ncbi:NAD(P)/FAD-dependent oxidoreductase [Evansella cellulosilytica]|uniref:FAD dependent oxidoreductase n=1 Tax=Evansella cellulosilytica (strain ATCC 21833 / DSM 2522 / FERM P-1141 / JCM 9156 / N-4) TaxID=649639 RepID=E6TQC2_EVAC2|nr:FAD-dependent oxidoreductase [Evansella cellulosilytica]ADU29300.1 FAD dependent oxidoreductase [Evansella cellulosilytica DSM 2522]
MNIQSGTYYWPTTMTDPPTYSPLNEDLNCDVLIVGGGSSGAQCAYYLSDTRLDVVLIEKNTIGSGSTSSNTAFIQYSGEKLFTDLVHTFGEEYIRNHLELCRGAINDMEEASTTVEIDFEFARKDSLYYASYPEDVAKLKKEMDFLTKQQFEMTFFTSSDIESKYGFKKAGALYSLNDAVINPFKFTHSLLDYSVKKGVKAFEKTEMNGYTYDKTRDKVVIRTKTGNIIHAKKVIFCAGYEGMDIKKEKQASFVSTYTVTTKPVSDLSQWYNRTLIWETARPYVFMRTTEDNRIIIGGLDETTIYPEVRDSKLMNKKDKLLQEFNKLFPDIKVEADYSVAAYYGGTVDGLPIIGKYEDIPNSYFLFGYGDNGTVYSQILSKLIVEEIVQGESKQLPLYLQNRPSKSG